MANVLINGLTAVHAGSNGILTTTDICKTPPLCPQIPYTNIAKSSDSAMTATSVLINGNPACTLKSNFAISNGDSPGSCGGTNSGTVNGMAEFITGSANVFIEGIPVVRQTDQMVSNFKNTPPMPLQQPGAGKPPDVAVQEAVELEAAELPFEVDFHVVGDEVKSLKSIMGIVDQDNAPEKLAGEAAQLKPSEYQPNTQQNSATKATQQSSATKAPKKEIKIKKSVGEGGVNNPDDVKEIQKLLNKMFLIHPYPGKLDNVAVDQEKINKLLKEAFGSDPQKLEINGIVDERMIKVIKAYQGEVCFIPEPLDGLIGTKGSTFRRLNDKKSKRPANVVSFIDKILPHAKRISKEYNIPVSICIAQGALESGWGEDVKGNAYFGVKTHGRKGKKVNINTTEYDKSGKKISIKDDFRGYDSLGDAVEDYAKFLHKNPRYKPTLAQKDPYKFANELKKAIYGTDPIYDKKVKRIIWSYDFEEYDQ